MTVLSAPASGDPILDQMLAGKWIDPETGRNPGAIPFRDIRLMDTTDGAEADLVGMLGLGRHLAVVSDPRTHAAMGGRVAKALRVLGRVDDVVVDPPEAETRWVKIVQEKTRHAGAVVAVGSGTIQDIVKFATFLDGRPFVTFATAASMNGYTSLTASITEGGFKTSLRAHAPAGLYMDVAVAAAAPPRLARSGLGDCLCRSTAQVDWRMSARLLGTPYFETPFTLQVADEAALFRQAAGLATGDPTAIRTLYRLLTWTGLGTFVTGTSHHGSMSEHLVSHWIDMFAGAAHPGTLHGHQVGFAAVSMSRLQHLVLDAAEPPRLGPTRLDQDGMLHRYGRNLGTSCMAEASAKALDASSAARLTEEMRRDWDGFRAPLRAVMLPTEKLEEALRAAGGYVTAAEAGLPAAVYRDALVHARDIRNRFSILDIAADAGILEAFAESEAARGPAHSSREAAL